MAEQLIELGLIIDNPYQPRITDDAEHIEKLARSIAADGLLQTPKARACADGTYQMAFGHSRRKAIEWLQDCGGAEGLPARYSGYTRMPVEIVELTDEEMYRYAVSENVQRKDLAPTELARSMQRYMEEFKASSKQAADLFGMNDATVRGMVRLLELPGAVQEKLDDGSISQGTARTFLSLQKIAPEKVIVETLKKIEKNPDSLPEEVIEDSIERMGEVVGMWSDGRNGKPRSSYHGWLLDMKNFPNKLLPILTPVDAAIALGIQNEEETMEKVSTWIQASLGELPDLDTETLGLNDDMLQKLDHLINPPACTACPFYTKIHGSHFCGIKTCYTRKAIAWNTSALQQASKNLKIELYQKSDGAYRALDSDSRSLFKNRHKGLRLLPKAQFKGYAYQYGYEGVDTDILVVVATGDAIDKMTTSSSRGGKKTEKEKAEMRMMKIYRLRRKELLWEFTGVAQSIFEAVPVTAVKRISAWHYVGVDDQIREEWKPKGATDEAKAAHEKRMLVWTLISDVCSHYQRRTMASILNDLQKKADEWGIKIPKSLISQATEWDAEIAAVAAATPGKGKK